jgi:T5SS/PEP-CTERM-associated repeat protein
MKGRLGILAIALLCGVLTGRSDDTTWTGSVLGDWFNAGNWSAGIPVFSATNTALINTGVATIGSGTSASSGILTVGGSSTGSTAGLGLSRASLFGYRIVAGRDAGANGLISISGTTSVTNYGGSTIGAAGTGALTISGASTFTTTSLVIGRDSGGIGTVEVNGIGSNVFFSSILESGQAFIGNAGTGTLRIVNGAWLDSGSELSVFVGVGGGSGTLEVAGTNSYLHADSMQLGAGTAEARDGGRISIAGDFEVSGNGSVEIGPGGRVVVADLMAFSEASSLVFTVDGDLAGEYGLLTAGHIDLDGTFRIELDGGYQPGLGDSFSLLAFTTVSGAFDAYDLPTLAPGLSWDTSLLAVDGSLHVIPEPVTSTLLIAGLAFLGSRRRR